MIRSVFTTIAILLLVSAPASAQAPLPDGTPLCGQEDPPGGAATIADPATLRVGTYNILHTMPDLAEAALDLRIDLLTAAIHGSGAHLVGTQEVIETGNHGNAQQRLAAGLAAASGHTWYWCWFQSNPHFPGEPDSGPGGGDGPATTGMEQNARSGEPSWSEGVGVLSVWPITDQRTRRLSPRTHEAAACDPADVNCRLEASFDSRQIHWNRIDTPFGALDFFSTHLAHTLTILSEDTRQRQIGDTLAFMAEVRTDEATPDFYVGDFNTAEGSPVWQQVADGGFLDSFRVAEPTADGFTSSQELDAPTLTVDGRIDYVWLRAGTCPVTPTSAEVIGDANAPFEGGVVWPSDHLGVVTTFEVAGECAVAVPAPTPDPGPAPPSPTPAPPLPTTGGGLALLGAFGALAAATTRRRPR